ncbi:MAG: polyprenyl diphosphate synthase [Mariprofundales bacterium]|nr:polyprenyl diphosphate synthase [Mariprofundales bacterium]
MVSQQPTSAQPSILQPPSPPTVRQLSSAETPAHVAIIMDGNGRWAKQHHLPRLEGHRRGADRARDVVEWAKDIGIKQLSLYAFSTENWERPDAEVRGLMALLTLLLPRRVPEMMREGVRLLALGDTAALPRRAQRALQSSMEKTANNSTIDLILCLNYGGRQEIVSGVRRALSWALQQSDPAAAVQGIGVEQFGALLGRDELLPVDLIIRTGGEYRISNFHLWDSAYAELYFSPTYWPEYSRADLQAAVDDYAARERRFGMTGEQIGRHDG